MGVEPIGQEGAPASMGRADGAGAPMAFRHADRPGFWLGLVDFCTAGLFFLAYMPLGGLQDELDRVLGRRTQRYWIAYLLGIPTLFIYPLVWMARIAEELKAKAVALGLEGPTTSWRHMFLWNTLGLPLLGPAVATRRFFDTLDRVERALDRDSGQRPAAVRHPIPTCKGDIDHEISGHPKDP